MSRRTGVGHVGVLSWLDVEVAPLHFSLDPIASEFLGGLWPNQALASFCELTASCSYLFRTRPRSLGPDFPQGDIPPICAAVEQRVTFGGSSPGNGGWGRFSLLIDKNKLLVCVTRPSLVVYIHRQFVSVFGLSMMCYAQSIAQS